MFFFSRGGGGGGGETTGLDGLFIASKLQASKQAGRKGRKKVNCSSYHGDSIKCEEIYKEYID